VNKPCETCPFRTDVPAYLNKARAREIVEALMRDGSFHCHNTIDYDHEDDDGFTEPRVTPKSHFCAGALGVMKCDGVLFNNRLVRLIAAWGWFQPDQLVLDDLPESFDDWIERQPDR